MRVFIGVELPEHVREACALLAHDCQSCAQGKWTLRENWHITLAFIGETETARLDELARIMTDAAARFAPPRLSLDAPGVFEKRGGGILYAGVRSDAPLEPLHDALCGALREQGFPCDPGPFRAHVTLARKARRNGGALPAPQPAAFRPAYLTLFESARDAQGILRYTPVRRCAWSEPCMHAQGQTIRA